MGKQDVTVELFYSGAWNTAPAYTRDPITVTRGRGDEQSEFVPSSASLTLDDRSRIYNPRNPLSPLYGLAGRNTPIRVRLPVTTDDFGTPVVDDWGTTDTGEEWSAGFGFGGTVLNSDFQVAGGVGKHFVPVAPGYRATYLPTVLHRDVGVLVDVDMVISDVTGAEIEPANILLRGQDISTYYMARLCVSASEVATLELFHSVNGSLGSPVTLTNFAWTSQPIRVYAEIEGQSIRAKAWDPAAGGEPYAWQVTVTDDAITAPGWVGVRSGVASGNTNTTPVEFRYTNFEVRQPRFSGEMASWKPRRTEDFNPATGRGDAWTEIEAAGILRRLGQGASPLRSAVHRVITGAAPIAYWSMEDGTQATQVGSGRPGAVAMAVAGAVTFGAVSTLSGSAPLPTLDTGASLVGTVPSYTATTEWVVSGFFNLSTDIAATTTLVEITTTGTARTWKLIVTPGSPDTMYLRAYNSSGVELAPAFGVIPVEVIYNTWQAFDIRVEELGGGDLQWQLSVTGDDGFAAGHSNIVVSDAGAVTSVRITATADLDGSGWGHFAVFDAANVSYLNNLWRAIVGWSGETAGERLTRVCDEEDVPFTLIGSADGQMGPQPAGKFTALLAEIEHTDDGLLYEPRGDAGLAYRPRESLYNQTPALTLDFAAGEVAPPLDPVVDDLDTRNDVTVERERGSSARAALDAGPLSVLPPPDGVGRVTTKVDVNTSDDTRLADFAGWHLRKGTVDATRYPRVTVDLDAVPALAAAASAVDIGDVITVANTEEGGASLLVLGYTETIGSHRRKITFNTTPAQPWTWITDTFTRNVPNAWGTADSGQEWSVLTTGGPVAGNYHVNGARGVFDLATTGVAREARLPADLATVDIVVGHIMVPVAPTGANITMALRARYVDGSNFVDVRLFANPGGTVTINLRSMSAGVEVFTGFPGVPGVTSVSEISLRFQAVGAQLRARAWLKGSAEPSTWQVELTANHFTAGDVAWRADRTPGNTNAAPYFVEFDDLAEVRL